MWKLPARAWFILCAMGLGSALSAQSLPVYDGVYIKEDGAWKEMSPIRFEDLGILAATVVESNAAPSNYKSSMGWHRFKAMNPEAVTNLTIVKDKPGQEIEVLVRGRNISLRRVDIVVSAKDLSDSVTRLPDQGGTNNLMTGRINNAGELSRLDLPLVDTGWGWGVEQFRARTIDQFTAEYNLGTYSWWEGTFGTPIAKSGKNLLVYGFLAKTSGGISYFFSLGSFEPRIRSLAR